MVEPEHPPVGRTASRGAPRGAPRGAVVVLVSGEGTLLQALLDAQAQAACTVVAVGSDRPHAGGLARARRAGVPTFVVPVDEHADRGAWDAALADAVGAHDPDLLVLAGFMRLVGPAVLDRFGGRTLNSHPSLLPAFPGGHAVRDALAAGATTTGASVILVDAGVDTGPVIAQQPVPVRDGDDEASLHERIKVVERRLIVDVVSRAASGARPLDGRQVVPA